MHKILLVISTFYVWFKYNSARGVSTRT